MELKMAPEYDYRSDNDDSHWEPIADDSSSESSGNSSGDDASTSSQDPEYTLGREAESSFSVFSFRKPRKKSPTSPGLVLRLVGKVCLVLLPLFSNIITPALTARFNGEESIYVPGVGFSGFWFTLGRLKSIKDPYSKHFVCFSAGCLGAVAILNEFSVDEMACMAATARSAWKSGDIGRFEVVGQFVDGLVYRHFPSNNDPLQCLGSLHGRHDASRIPIDSLNILSKLHILTTEKAYGVGAKASMRSPTSLHELREMLIQTAWVPFATGNGFMRNDHMDGGFSFWWHPRCTKSVNLPLDAGLILNSLNVHMGRDEAYRLWNEGIAYGL